VPSLLTITMLGVYFIAILSTTIELCHVLAAPVSHTDIGKSISTNNIAAENSNKGSSSTSSKVVKSTRTPSNSERIVPYKPRVTSRLFTGTARQQVEQLSYRLAPKGLNETDEEFQARKVAKVHITEARKLAHLRKIERLEKEFPEQGEEVITKHYNNWILGKQEKKNLLRVKTILNLDNLTLDGYKEMRGKEQQSDTQGVTEQWKISQHYDKKMYQRKYTIKELMKKGDEQSIQEAKEKMERYGITDLTDARKLGIKKGHIRKTLLKNFADKVALREALELGMDPNALPLTWGKATHKEYARFKRLASTGTGAIGNARGQASSSKERHGESSTVHPSSTSLAKKKELPFDLNLEPPIDQE
jgi:hypothetical protein